MCLQARKTEFVIALALKQYCRSIEDCWCLNHNTLGSKFNLALWAVHPIMLVSKMELNRRTQNKTRGTRVGRCNNMSDLVRTPFSLFIFVFLLRYLGDLGSEQVAKPSRNSAYSASAHLLSLFFCLAVFEDGANCFSSPACFWLLSSLRLISLAQAQVKPPTPNQRLGRPSGLPISEEPRYAK